jgi:hypothetical protein
VVVFINVLTGLIQVQGEDVENPQYTNWSRFPVGTSVTTKDQVIKDNKSITTITTTKLISKTEKNIILSTVVSSDATGMLVTNDPWETVIKRQFPLLPGVDKTKIGRPQGTIATGMETIEILGKKYQSEWYDIKSSTEAGPAITRTWISMDMPGMVIKSSTEVKNANRKTLLEVTELKIP